MARQRSRRWGPRWRGTVSKSSSGWGCGPRHETPPVVALEGVRVKAQRFSVVLVKSNGIVGRPVSRSTIEGGGGDVTICPRFGRGRHGNSPSRLLV